MENCEQVKNTFPDGNSNLMNHMNEDSKLIQQSPQMSSDACQIHFLLSQLAQQWQKERLEIRQDLMFICQYLNSLAERQEQQWHQIQYNHIQSMNETRQNFQALNVLINTVLSQANFTHMFSTEGSELKEDLTETRIQEENISSQHLEMTSNQDNAAKHETFSTCSENITKSDHNVATDLKINSVVEPLVEEQVGSMPKINVQQHSMQFYHKQGLTDAGRNCQTYEQNVHNVNEQFVTLDISNRQSAVNELDWELLNSREQKEKHKKTNTKINSETNEVSSENDVIVPDLDFHKGKMKVRLQHLDKNSNKKSYNHMSEPVNQSEKELEITQEPKEYKTFAGHKDSHKMYADAVITSKTLPVNLEIHSSIKEIHFPDMPVPVINPVDIPVAEKSFQGTGIYADAISKLMSETDSSSLSSEKSRVSSTGQTYHKTMAKKGMTQSRTKESSRNTKENRTRKMSDKDY